MKALTNEERAIESSIDHMAPLSGDKRKRVETIIARAKKNRAISLRIADHDLERLKEKAENDGIPYQTLISMVLHKYITNQLVDKSEALKSIQLLQDQDVP